jgi:hypothetical protein
MHAAPREGGREEAKEEGTGGEAGRAIFTANGGDMATYDAAMVREE